MGNQAGMWIPILKIVIEIVFYGAFPLVILVAMIPNLTASVLRGYFITFFWLSSWGPIYAILHRIIMGHGKTYTLSLTKGIGLKLAIVTDQATSFFVDKFETVADNIFRQLNLELTIDKIRSLEE